MARKRYKTEREDYRAGGRVTLTRGGKKPNKRPKPKPKPKPKPQPKPTQTGYGSEEADTGVPDLPSNPTQPMTNLNEGYWADREGLPSPTGNTVIDDYNVALATPPEKPFTYNPSNSGGKGPHVGVPPLPDPKPPKTPKVDPKQKIFESNEKNINQIKKLILKDESDTCEFKRSAVWGPGNTDDIKIKNGKKQILKAIAGFSNSKKGGVLLVGVHDNKEIIGLEDDFKFRGNKDKWIQVIVMNFKVAFGDDFSPTWLNQYFVADNDKEVYVIEVSPNIEPIFLDEDFYVRDGNVTSPLKGKSQSSFIQQRFY